MLLRFLSSAYRLFKLLVQMKCTKNRVEHFNNFFISFCNSTAQVTEVNATSSLLYQRRTFSSTFIFQVSYTYIFFK